MEFEIGKERRTVGGETVFPVVDWRDHRCENDYPLEGIIVRNGKGIRYAWSISGEVVRGSRTRYDLYPRQWKYIQFAFVYWSAVGEVSGLHTYRTREGAEIDRKKFVLHGKMVSQIMECVFEEQENEI